MREEINDLTDLVGDGSEPWNADTAALRDAVRILATGFEQLQERTAKIDRVLRDLATSERRH